MIIKIFRVIFDIGQRELADAAGISARELARIEAAEASPSPKTFRALDNALMGIIKGRVIEATVGNWEDLST